MHECSVNVNVYIEKVCEKECVHECSVHAGEYIRE